MKKFSVIVLAIALVMMMSVPFCASADAAVAITVPNKEIEVGTADVEMVINYETAEYLLDGTFEISYPADKLQLVVAEATGPKDPANALSPMPNVQVNAKESGKVIVVFADPDGVSGTGEIIKLPFKVLNGAAGDEYDVTIKATRLVKWVEGNVSGENLVTDTENFETTGKIVVKAAATTTAAPATTTAAPVVTTTAAPTTKAPSTTGEATPWALLATVTVAGAALVVLSTKKSK